MRKVEEPIVALLHSHAHKAKSTAESTRNSCAVYG